LEISRDSDSFSFCSKTFLSTGWIPRLSRGSFINVTLLFLCAAAVPGCGGSGGNGTNVAASQARVATNLAQIVGPNIVVTSIKADVSPFIAEVILGGIDPSTIRSVAYTIAPKPGSVSAPVNVTYTIAALMSRSHSRVLTSLTIFGLYSNYANDASIQITFNDSSMTDLSILVPTKAYTDPTGIYDKPFIVKARPAGSALGFDFFAMKSALGTPIIVDTDGEIRWAGVGITSAMSSILTDNGFIIGDQKSTKTYVLELDGTVTPLAPLAAPLANFTHNIDLGKWGYLGEFDEAGNIGATVSEFTMTAGAGKVWNLATIISSYMISKGDDAGAFVRNGSDWFHINATTYDPADNTVIVSSRENFVIKLDYETGDIIWILGDPTKYWYTFPSLRAKALMLAPGGLYPIGQHALSITSDGLLMLFNDGYQSLNQPAGEPAGASRTYSAVSAYAIDAATLTATEAWRFDYNETLLSNICSSSYEALDKSLLVDYAFVANGTLTRLVGLDEGHNVVFDFQYANSSGCNTSWNAVPIHLESMFF
jgi:hypothetical protein